MLSSTKNMYFLSKKYIISYFLCLLKTHIHKKKPQAWSVILMSHYITVFKIIIPYFVGKETMSEKEIGWFTKIMMLGSLYYNLGHFWGLCMRLYHILPLWRGTRDAAPNTSLLASVTIIILISVKFP